MSPGRRSDGVEKVHRLPLPLGERRHALDLLRRGHAIAVPLAEQPPLAHVVDRVRIEGSLVGSLLRLAAEVEGFVQRRREIGALRGYAVVRRDRAGHHAHAARPCPVVAGEGDDVGAVRVEVELGPGGIAAAGRTAVDRARVPHRRDIVAGLALRPRNTGVQADRPCEQFEFLFSELLARQAAHQRDAAAALHLVEGRMEDRRGGAELEVGAVVIEQLLSGVHGAPHRLDQVSARPIVQDKDPTRIGPEFLGGPRCARALGHWLHSASP